jgi:hypothetical protein
MATIALNALGSAIGGPVGGAIGAILGQQIDRSILGPKPSEGPRLTELDIQTSSYGSSIPAIFGAMRVAGTVIWATDLIESRNKSGGGKGRPSTINFSYSANLAIALSSRPLQRIGRIWADGNLLRGAAGDFKVQTGFRFYDGHGDQPLDPLIASAQEAGQCPAHRGLAYVVFEGLQLADFGNHIPSLTFEVFEREGEVLVTDICRAASNGKIRGNSHETLVGFALDGRSAKAALAPLLTSFPVILRPKNAQLDVIDWADIGPSPRLPTVVASAGSTQFERSNKQRSSAHKIPAALGLRYYEPQRDFQLGIQRSERFGGGQASQITELPAALSASTALRIADLQLLQMQHRRDALSCCIETGPDPLHVGDWLLDSEGDGPWRVNEIEHLNGAMRIAATRFLASGPSRNPNAEAGVNAPSVDAQAGSTLLSVIELPVLNQTDPGHALIAVVAAGTKPGWRNAALSLRQNNQLVELGGTTGIAIMGSATVALAPHPPFIVDLQNALEVRFSVPETELPAGYGSPLAPNAPLCWVSGEYIRYGQATYLGQGHYRLTQLMRGCFGTEVHAFTHAVGDRFILLDVAQIRMLDEIPMSIGQTVEIEALGLGDEHPVPSTLTVTGRAIVPFSPVHGVANRRQDGGIEVSWKRRSRVDYGWQDGVDQPIVEESELYRVRLLIAGQMQHEWIVTTSALSITPFQASAISGLGDHVSIEVHQIGRHGVSAPLMITEIGS